MEYRKIQCGECHWAGYVEDITPTKEGVLLCPECNTNRLVVGWGDLPKRPEYKIVDKDGVQLDDRWAVRPRTFDRVKKLLDSLNSDGEYGPYRMVSFDL